MPKKGYKQTKEHIASRGIRVRTKPNIYKTERVYKYPYPEGLTAKERTQFRDKLKKRRARKLNPRKYIEEAQRNILKNRFAYLARKKLWRTVKSGKLKREKCRDCGRLDTHGHHTDYSKPLEVIWLCPSHHKLEHLRINKEKLQLITPSPSPRG